MTIEAHFPHTPAGPASADPGTHGIQAAGEPPVNLDSYALLDHRTRRRTVSREDAGAGRYLTVDNGAQVRLIPLERGIIHIGRGLISDVRIGDPGVSRSHAIIAQRGDGARVLDDRSANGTFLNGRPVATARLSDGDVLRIGSVVFGFTEIAARVEAGPPAAAIRRRIPLPVRAPGSDRTPW